MRGTSINGEDESIAPRESSNSDSSVNNTPSYV